MTDHIDGLAALLGRLINEANATREPIELDVEADLATMRASGAHLHIDELAPYRARPRRVVARPRTITAAAFLAYFDRFARADDAAPVVFCTPPRESLEHQIRDAGAFRCVFDYHETGDAVLEAEAPAEGPLDEAEAARLDVAPEALPATVAEITVPRWGDHAVDLELEFDRIWRKWRDGDGAKRSQAATAEHLEDLAPYIHGDDGDLGPSAATMCEVALHLTANTAISFERAERLQSGDVRFTYHENTTADAQGPKGTIQIPESFTIRCPVYTGGEPVLVTARFRYRINSGELTLSYHLVRADEAERDAFDVVRAEIAAHVESTPRVVPVLDVAALPDPAVAELGTGGG